jgi:hypothetical protein
MKNTVFTALFVFSIVLNLAVGGTVLWHVILEPRWENSAAVPVASSLSESDVEKIRRMGLQFGRESIIEIRKRILEKNREILDIVSRNPNDPGVADAAIKELIALKWMEEKKAVDRICGIMASMPQERRARFLEFLKRRTCRGRGMGIGMGRGRGMGGPGCRWKR